MTVPTTRRCLCILRKVNFGCSTKSKYIQTLKEGVTTIMHAEKLVHAFVTSKLDSCNSLIYGLPACQEVKLQRIQNAAARLVARVKKFVHISPVLNNLHWLTVRKRITFKILLTTYKLRCFMVWPLRIYRNCSLSISHPAVYDLKSLIYS